LAEISLATSRELADNTGMNERYVREWLSANAAAGYVNYDPAAGRFLSASPWAPRPARSG
jgi:DNA-binding IclR family transcriptional regulator